MSPDRSIRLRTERLVLRPTMPDDVYRALEIRSDPAVARNLVSATLPPDAQKMTAWFATHAEEWRDGTAYRFAILHEKKMIGVIDLFDIADGTGEIGYWLDRADWGRGFGREAARRVVCFAFDDLGITTLLGACAADNAASAAILTRLGFTPLDDVQVFSNSRQEEITQLRFTLRR
ncbi:GNAT family N-acetyltransferase [Devosia sp.]|uniref:GNAT family N-acetyltransferase n=1 Tax=Devosia sp. TaxID=1871048 RepID=UPI003A90CAF5